MRVINLNLESPYCLFSTWIQTSVNLSTFACLRNPLLKWGHMKPLQSHSLYVLIKHFKTLDRLWQGKTMFMIKTWVVAIWIFNYWLHSSIFCSSMSCKEPMVDLMTSEVIRNISLTDSPSLYRDLKTYTIGGTIVNNRKQITRN